MTNSGGPEGNFGRLVSCGGFATGDFDEGQPEGGRTGSAGEHFVVL
jgi:hypothetical protein